MMEADRKADRLLTRGRLTGLVITVFAIGLMFSTINISHPLNLELVNNPLACHGDFGVGFPVSFLCDYGAGGSPLSGTYRIDSSDFPFFSPLGTLVDILFYATQLWVIWFVAIGIFRKRSR
jgi:hypothetical protein